MPFKSIKGRRPLLCPQSTKVPLSFCSSEQMDNLYHKISQPAGTCATSARLWEDCLNEISRDWKFSHLLPHLSVFWTLEFSQCFSVANVSKANRRWGAVGSKCYFIRRTPIQRLPIQHIWTQPDIKKYSWAVQVSFPSSTISSLPTTTVSYIVSMVWIAPVKTIDCLGINRSCSSLGV